MAWTNAKTAIVVGTAVILAAGTTTLVVKHQHQQQPAGPISENSWAFKGYATPEAALQTSLWAMSKGDMKTLTAGYTPEFQAQFMETAGNGKSDSQLGAMFTQVAGIIGDFQIDRQETVSSDELILHFRSSGQLGNASVPMKKIGNEWKINGNLASDSQKPGAH